MIRKIDGFNLSSENPRVLAEFYQKIVGLGKPEEAEMGDEGEEVFWWDLDGCQLIILHHSEVSGKNSQPGRMMVNFEVSNIEEEVKKVADAGAKKIQDIYHIEGYGYVATFEDPDGNYFQLVQVREEKDGDESHSHGHDHNHDSN